MQSLYFCCCWVLYFCQLFLSSLFKLPVPGFSMLIRSPGCNWTFHPITIFPVSQARAQFLVIRLVPSPAGNLLKAVVTGGGLSLLKLYVVSLFFPVWGSLTQGHISTRVSDSVRVHYVYCSLLCNCGNIFSCFWIQNLPGLCHALCF